MQRDLTDQEKAVLDFEGDGWWQHQGAKEQAVRDRLGMTATRYYQVLNSLRTRPEAFVYAPAVVRRLERVHQNRLTRSATAFG